MEKRKINLKNDRYRRDRGGQAEILSIFCSACGNPIMLYQKDGIGQLLRCYLNRIFAPPYLESLQYETDSALSTDLPSLNCRGCGVLIGVTMKYRDGRLAYRLVPGSIKKKKGISEIFFNE